MDRNAKKLGEERITKLLVNFSMPAIIGMIVNSLYTVIDRIFVGHFVGSEAFAGVGVTFAISMLIMAFGMLIGIGTSARISIALGRQRVPEAEKILGNAFVLLVTITLILSLAVFLFLEQILEILGASHAIKPYAVQFMQVILSGTVFQSIAFGLNGVIAAQGKPRTSMVTMIINASVNILLLYVFVVVMKMGVKGSALATVIAQLLASIWVLSHLAKKDGLVKLKWQNMLPDKVVIAGIVSVGMSPFLMQLSGSVVMGILNKDLAHYGGDMAIGAMNAIFGIAMFLVMPIIGINQGMQPIVGYNYGAKLYKRVKNTLKGAIVAATVYAIVVFAMIQFFPSFFINIFTDDIEIMAIGTYGIKIYLMMFPFIAFQIISAHFFLAIGKAVKSMMMNLLRQIIVLIPLLLVLPKFIGLPGVWISVPISDFIAAVLTAYFLFGEMKHLNKAQYSMDEDNLLRSVAKESFPESEGPAVL